LKIPTQLIPESFFGGAAGKYYAGAFGTSQTTGGTVQFTQTLFNAQVLIGLKAAKVAVGLNELQVLSTKEDVVYDVVSTYYNVQTEDQQLDILMMDLANSDSLIASTKLLLDNGLSNKTSYNKLWVNRENIRAQYLPTASFAVNYGLSGYYSEFSPFQTINNTYYPSSLFNVTLKVPIFARKIVIAR
jgi:outer membrane protein